jgi:hypothetical protein
MDGYGWIMILYYSITVYILQQITVFTKCRLKILLSFQDIADLLSSGKRKKEYSIDWTLFFTTRRVGINIQSQITILFRTNPNDSNKMPGVIDMRAITGDNAAPCETGEQKELLFSDAEVDMIPLAEDVEKSNLSDTELMAIRSAATFVEIIGGQPLDRYMRYSRL